MSIAEKLHEAYGFDRRVRVLSSHIEPLLPEGAHVLDVGCGDGTIDSLICTHRGDIEIEGIDVLVRPETKIEVKSFDGVEIPHPDDRFDCVLFVDVLHHSGDAMALLREAKRVARKAIVIKDHLKDGLLAEATLRFMDDVGNKRFGVDLPYNYWRHAEWAAAFRDLSLTVETWKQALGIYPWPATWLFDRGLHFVARLEIDGSSGA